LTRTKAYELHKRHRQTACMNESIGLGRITGIRVGLNWSLLPIFLLLVWSLAESLLPSAAPGFAGWGYWTLALLATSVSPASCCGCWAVWPSLRATPLIHAPSWRWRSRVRR